MSKAYPGATWEQAAVNAAWNPLQASGTNMPGMGWAERDFGVEPLFKSSRGIALLGDKMIVPNMGKMPAGLLLSTVVAGPRTGMVFPYEFAVPLAADTSTTAVAVAENHAFYFTVGDVLTAHEGETPYELGAITTISAPIGGKVTLTVAQAPGAAMTAAGGTITYKNNGAMCVLDQAAVSLSEGAYISVAYGNMILHKAVVRNYTGSVHATMPGFVDGTYIIFR